MEKSFDNKKWWTAKRREQLGALAGYVLWVVICFIGVQLLVGLIILGLQASGVSATVLNQNLSVLVTKLGVFVMMIAALLLLPKLLWKESTSAETVGLQRLLKWSDIGLAVIGLVAAAGGSILILWLSQYIMPWVNLDQPQNLGVSFFNSGTELALAFVVFVIVGPVVEEVIFRGFLYGKLREIGVRFWPTTLIVSALFALAHWQWNVALDVFVLSIIMCVLRQKTGALWVTILMHILKNGVAFYFTFIYVIMSGL